MKIQNLKLKFKTFLLWMLLTNILYILSNYISSKVIHIQNPYFLILYDIAITVGILSILYFCINKAIPLKVILQKHYKLLLIIFLILVVFNNLIEKYMFATPYQALIKFLLSNLQISIIYITLLLLTPKKQN